MQRWSERSRLILHVPADITGGTHCRQDGQADCTAFEHPGRQPSQGLAAISEAGLLEKRHPIEGLTKDLLCVGAQVGVQDLLVDGPEVDGVLEVAGAVQVAEAGRLAVNGRAGDRRVA